MSPSTSASNPPRGSGLDDSATQDIALVEVRHRKVLLTAVIMVAVMQFLDATIANVALPHMKVSLGAGNDTISWVLTSYIVSTAVFMPMTGWLSERVGSRNLFIWSTALFLLASAACGASTNLAQIVIFRTLQGIGSAFITPMTQSILFDISPPSKQASAMSLFGLLVMIAPISGPVLGGLLTEQLSWRWVFYVNLPIGIPALIVLWALLPNRPGEGRKLDLAGLIWLGISLASLQMLLDRGEHKDWFNSWEIIIEAMVAVSALWIYLIHNAKVDHPLFNKALFKNPNFIAAIVMMFVIGINNVSLSATLPMLYQNLYEYPVIQTGLLMVPRAVGILITMILVQKLMRIVDFRLLISAGYLIAAYTTWMMTAWTLEVDSNEIIWIGFIQGLGMGLLFSPMNLAAFASVEPMARPDGSSVLSLSRNIGSSIGISLMVTLLARNTQTSHADLAAHITSSTIPGIDLNAAIQGGGPTGDAVVQMIDGEINRQAAMIAYLDSFSVLVWVLLVMAIMPIFIRKPAQMEVMQGRAAPQE
jgi:DHA2 family multidrug resistance protein